MRLVAQMGNLRLSQADLMRIADITKSSVSAYCNGNRLPPSDATIRISKALDVRPEWLILGTGPKEDSKVFSPHVAESDSDQGIWRGGLKPASPPIDMKDWTIKLPMVDLRFTGARFELEKMEPDFTIDAGAYASLGAAMNASLVAGIMPTDALAPRITEGSYLLIDQNDRILREGVFVFLLGENLQVKKLRPTGTKGVEILSENPHYLPQVVIGDELAAFNILGRVVMALGRV